jgi:hypothetical protein
MILALENPAQAKEFIQLVGLGGLLKLFKTTLVLAIHKYLRHYSGAAGLAHGIASTLIGGNVHQLWMGGKRGGHKWVVVSKRAGR